MNSDMMHHVTTHGRIMSGLIDNTWYIPPTNKATISRRGAGGVVVRKDSQNCWWVALVLGDHDGADYILPKGGVKKKETLEQAARREIREEAGFSELTALQELATCERLTFGKTRWSITTYFLFETTEIDVNATDKKIQYTTHWHPLNALPSNIFWPEQRQLLEQVQRHLLL